MQEIPDILLEWSEIDWSTGERVLKNNAPKAVKEQAHNFEVEFYNKTARRMFTNINID